MSHNVMLCLPDEISQSFLEFMPDENGALLIQRKNVRSSQIQVALTKLSITIRQRNDNWKEAFIN